MTWKNTKREAEMRRERWRQGDERGPQKDVRLRPEARELERQTQGRWGGGGTKLEEARWGQVGWRRKKTRRQQEGRRKKGKEREEFKEEGRQQAEKSRGNTQKPEEAPNMGTWKTNLRYSGNWGHWNLQRKNKKYRGKRRKPVNRLWRDTAEGR